MLHQPQLRAIWQKWAKDYVKQFNYPDIVDRYEAFYKDALKQHGKR